MPILIPYPNIDPILITLGPFSIRWYALAYIAGLTLGWAYAHALAARPKLWGGAPRPDAATVDDLLIYAALGVILGGRIGYVLFYNPWFYFERPLDIPAVWKGGMSFHGGFVGTALAIIILARRRRISILSIMDLCAAVVPIGLFLGRIANFIKPELWGRPTDVAWAMIFPGGGPLPRHPSQLYEAGLEGVALFFILFAAIRLGALQRPGLVSGIFAASYGIARIICEFFREPDPQLGFLFGGATMGMLLSLPMIALGLFLGLRARRAKTALA